MLACARFVTIAAAALLAAVAVTAIAPPAVAAERSFGSLGGRVAVTPSGRFRTVAPREGVSAQALQERLSRIPDLHGHPISRRDGAGRPLVLELDREVDGETILLESTPEIAWILPAVVLPDGQPLGLTADVVVVMDSGVDPDQMASRITRLGGRVTGAIPRIGVLRVTLELPITLDGIFTLCEALRSERGVRDAHPDFLRFDAGRGALNDPRVGSQWYMEKVGLPDAFDVTTGSPEVVVAVLDDGFDLTHEDLPGPDRRAPGAFDFRDQDDDPSAGPFDDHGTPVAGIAVASANNCKGITGACPGCRFLPLRRGTTDYDDMAAFAYLAGAGVHVVNNSWGYAHPSTGVVTALQALVETGRDGLGTLVVFAAGNDGRDIDAIHDISATPGVLAVAATGPDDAPAENTNHGSSIGIAAPGGQQFTTDRSVGGLEVGPYTPSFGGTSGAAPVVTGTAGLVFSVDPTRTAAEVRAILSATAVKVGSEVDAEGKSPVYGSGRLDAAAAVALAAGVDRDTLGEIPKPAPSCGGDESDGGMVGCGIGAGSEGAAQGIVGVGVLLAIGRARRRRTS